MKLSQLPSEVFYSRSWSKILGGVSLHLLVSCSDPSDGWTVLDTILEIDSGKPRSRMQLSIINLVAGLFNQISFTNRVYLARREQILDFDIP